MKMLLSIFSILLMASGFVFACSGLKHRKIMKAMDTFGQSKFIKLYSKYVQTKIDRCMSYGDELASQKYQDLALQAQKALNIPFEFQLPVKKFKQSTVVKAVAGSDGIYVNEDALEKMSFGAQRCTMFHESVHVKYHDAAVLGLFKIMGFCIGFAGMYELLEICNIAMLHKSLSVVSGAISSFVLSFKYRQFMEQRADIQGHQATGCAWCVQEEIDQRTNMFETAQQNCFKNMPEEQKEKIQQALKKRYPDKDPAGIFESFECIQGYLPRSGLKEIKQDLADKKCAYHLEHKK